MDGRIHGHAVFRYPNGDQREGFFKENILDGQVSTNRQAERAEGRIYVILVILIVLRTF